MTAYYNKPDDERDLVAHFHTAEEANDYAAKYGGTVNSVGVVFTVSGKDAKGKLADHAQAREDVRNARDAADLAAAHALIAAHGGVVPPLGGALPVNAQGVEYGAEANPAHAGARFDPYTGQPIAPLDVDAEPVASVSARDAAIAAAQARG